MGQTASRQFTLTITPAASPAPTGSLWLAREEILALPMSGPAWVAVKAAADANAGVPDLGDQDQNNNVLILAKALVYARTGIPSYRDQVVAACMDTMPTATGRTLALGRELAAYVIAADLVGLPANEAAAFKTWLAAVVRKKMNDDGNYRTLIECQEQRPNNWGTHAGGSLAAVARYTGDTGLLNHVAQVFRGWLGDRSAYAGFTYGSLSWQSDPAHPVGINPLGATIQGHNVDGVLPDDQRRGGSFTWPPPKENYVYEALQGALVEAVILSRAGFDVFNWCDRALARAYRWLYEVCQFPAQGDDLFQLPLADYYLVTDYWQGNLPVKYGKNLGWTDWTHASR